MPQENPSILTAGEINKAPQQGNSVADIQFQHMTMGQAAAGFAAGKGIGRRTVPNPQDQFTNTSLSGSQFGNGHAKSTLSTGG